MTTTFFHLLMVF